MGVVEGLGWSYPAEGFDLFDVVGNHRGLGSFVVAIELGEVVDLDVVLDSIAETGYVRADATQS